MRVKLFSYDRSNVSRSRFYNRPLKKAIYLLSASNRIALSQHEVIKPTIFGKELLICTKLCFKLISVELSLRQESVSDNVTGPKNKNQTPYRTI